MQLRSHGVNHGTWICGRIDNGYSNERSRNCCNSAPPFSAKSGSVSQITTEMPPGGGAPGGNLVRVNHADGTQGVYLHLMSPASNLGVDRAQLALIYTILSGNIKMAVTHKILLTSMTLKQN